MSTPKPEFCPDTKGTWGRLHFLFAHIVCSSSTHATINSFTDLRIKIWFCILIKLGVSNMRQITLVSGDKMTAIAGCDVSAGVVSKTWCGPRGVQQPDGPGDHYASHRLLSTVAPWRQSRSLGSPCGVGCQSPSLALAWSLPDSHFSPL